MSAYIRVVYTDITCCLPAQDSVAATVLVTYNAPWKKATAKQDVAYHSTNLWAYGTMNTK